MFITETATLPAPIHAAHDRLDALLAGGEATRIVTEILREQLSAPDVQARLDYLPGYGRGGAVVFPVRWWMAPPTGAWLPFVDANLELSGRSDGHTTLRYVGTARSWETPGIDDAEAERRAGTAALGLLGRLLPALLDTP